MSDSKADPGAVPAATRPELIEALAAWDHHAWAGWTRYLLDHLTPENIARWERQIVTVYADLSEAEQASDRKEAREILDVVQHYQASGWQPIETAPKDGTEILGLVESGSRVIMRWSDDASYAEAWNDAEYTFQPIQWQALPPPPDQEKEC